jgi:hypothetical protein
MRPTFVGERMKNSDLCALSEAQNRRRSCDSRGKGTCNAVLRCGMT